MKYLISFSFFALFIFSTNLTLAQIINDSLKTIPKKEMHRYNSASSFILPSSLIVYGILAQNVQPLRNLNESARNAFAAPVNKQTNIDDYLQFVPAISSHVISLAGVKAKHKLFDRLMIDGMTAAISISTVYITKKISKETRPDGSDNESFPSNHVATAFASAELLRQEYGDVSPWYGVAGYAVATATAYLRMYNNQHWLGDVVAGAGIGIVSAKIATQLFPIAKKILFHNKTPFWGAVVPSYQNGNLVFHFYKELR